MAKAQHNERSTKLESILNALQIPFTFEPAVELKSYDEKASRTYQNRIETPGGHHLDEENVEQITIKAKKGIASEETKKKMSESMKTWWKNKKLNNQS